MQRDRLNLQFGRAEQITRVLHALFADIFAQRSARFSLEDGAKIAKADALSGSQSSGRELGRQIGVDHENGMPDHGGIVLQRVILDEKTISVENVTHKRCAVSQ